MTRPPDVEGPAADSTRGPAQEVVDVANARDDSTNTAIVGAANVPVKPRSPLPMVEVVVEIDLEDLMQGEVIPDRARHRVYTALIGLQPGMHVRLRTGAAKWWPPLVVREVAYYTRSARTVAVVGSNAGRVQRLATELENCRRQLGGEVA